MSQAYASNAESVKDYLKDYTDEQINTMGEMVSSEQNMAMQEWRNKAEQIRAAKELTLEESGELLGGIVGVKGIGKGISKVKDLYKKGQEARKAAEELKNKVKEAAQKGKDATEKIKKDLEDKTKSKSQKSKEDNDPENDEGDLDGDVASAADASDADAEAAEQEGSKDVDDGEGDTKDTDTSGDTGGDTADTTAEGGEADSAIDFDNLEDVSTDTLRNFFSSRIGSGRDAIKQAREDGIYESEYTENLTPLQKMQVEKAARNTMKTESRRRGEAITEEKAIQSGRTTPGESGVGPRSGGERGQRVRGEERQVKDMITTRERRGVTSLSPENEDTLRRRLNKNKGGSITKKKMGAIDYRKGGMVYSTAMKKRGK